MVVLDAAGVAVVSDVGEIPQGVPLPHLPELSQITFDVILGAMSVAAIVLVQGSGVAESAPNRDGSRSNANQDFIAQGVGNIASSLFRGQPVGGSVGQTALNIAAGARTRWASIFSGLWMLLILVAFGGIVGRVAMPTLAAVLIVAAIGSLRVRRGADGVADRAQLTDRPRDDVPGNPLPARRRRRGHRCRALPAPPAEPRRDGPSRRRAAEAGGWPIRGAARHRRASRTASVTVLDVYGSLLYAGARTLEARLPNPGSATMPVVVLRVRGRTTFGATALSVLRSYAHRLEALGGRLFVSGVDPKVSGLIRRTGRASDDRPFEVVEATPIIGESTDAAFEQATAWIAERSQRPGITRFG